MEACLDWLTDPAMWSGPNGIPVRLLEHVIYSAVSVLIAAAIAVPLGLLTGHLGRGSLPTTTVATYWRAVPTLGVVVLVFQLEPLSVWPVLVALVLVALPPILLNTDAALRSVDPGSREAAVGMGMTGPQVLRRVELPLAVPLILTGLRSATAQVVATATVAAFVGLGGLGRYIIDGYANRDFAQITGGALLITGLALGLDGLLAVLQRRLDPTAGPRRRMPGYLLGSVSLKEKP
ncbi:MULTISPECIES: ABC transporter permease [unclassified Kribbella]|uniref:ABC transporter permease n=1 Tax=unclassified Kribbella TaxID=2644121 RepID=UPI0033E77657